MARVIFLLLVLANLLVFVWAAGYLGGAESGREPERLQNQLLPERLKVSHDGTPPADKLATAAGPVDCRRTGPMGGAEADALEKAIVGQGGRVTRTPVDDVSYWAYIPAVNKKPNDKELEALKKAGVKDFLVLAEDGPNRNAISLGKFRKEANAKEMIARLNRDGIKSARIATQTTPSGTLTLRVGGPTAVLDKALAGLTTEAVECPKE